MDLFDLLPGSFNLKFEEQNASASSFCHFLELNYYYYITCVHVS